MSSSFLLSSLTVIGRVGRLQIQCITVLVALIPILGKAWIACLTAMRDEEDDEQQSIDSPLSPHYSLFARLRIECGSHLIKSVHSMLISKYLLY